MTKTKKYRDRKWLREQYWEEGKRQAEIANQCSVYPSTICKWMNKFNIERRDQSTVISNIKDNGQRYREKDWLKEKYRIEKMPVEKIANLCDVDKPTINKWIRKLGIKRLTPKYKKYDWLYEQIVEKERTHPEIAQECNIHRSTVIEWTNKFDIHRRDAQTIEDGEKRCSKCEKWLPIDEFYTDDRKSTGLKSHCIECFSEDTEKWRQNHREQIRKAEQKRRENDPRLRIKSNISRAILRYINKGTKTSEEILPFDYEDLYKRIQVQFEDGMTWDNYGYDGWHIDHKKPVSKFEFSSMEDQAFKDCFSLANLQPLWAHENLSKQATFNLEEF